MDVSPSASLFDDVEVVGSWQRATHSHWILFGRGGHVRHATIVVRVQHSSMRFVILACKGCCLPVKVFYQGAFFERYGVWDQNSQ